MNAAPTDRPSRERLWFALAAATALACALVVALVLGSGDGNNAPARQGFEPVYEDLEQRREAAGVSTMGDPADPDAHLHPNLALYAEGESISIPVNIGIDPSKPGEEMASLHTHSSDGTIHVEGMSEATLGQFFRIWGVPFSQEQLGPYAVDAENSMRMWVDGEPSDEFERLRLADGQRIVLAYGSADELTQAAP